MMRFLSYGFYAAALIFLLGDLLQLAEYGSWRWYTMSSVLEMASISVNGSKNPMTFELLQWLRPVPVCVCSLAVALYLWAFVPQKLGKVISDIS